jgi:hypothetical protein
VCEFYCIFISQAHNDQSLLSLNPQNIRKNSSSVRNGFVTYEVNWKSMTTAPLIMLPSFAFLAEALLPQLKHISMADGFK